MGLMPTEAKFQVYSDCIRCWSRTNLGLLSDECRKEQPSLRLSTSISELSFSRFQHRSAGQVESEPSTRQFEGNYKDTMSKIFVGNLSFQTTQEELLATFSQFGNVEQVNIVTDRDTGQPRGFAFVEMGNPQEAQTAISQLNAAELHGRALNVSEARPKPSGSV